MRSPAGTLATEDGRVVCATCAVADTPWTRLRGLLGRRSLPRGEGLLLRPSPSVHTFFMRFAIDVVFLDARGVVRRIVRGLRPWRVTACLRGHAVLETAAGAIERSGTMPGDRLVVTAIPQEPATSSTIPA